MAVLYSILLGDKKDPDFPSATVIPNIFEDWFILYLYISFVAFKGMEKLESILPMGVDIIFFRWNVFLLKFSILLGI